MPSPVLLFVLVSFIIYSFRVLIFSPFHFSTFSPLKSMFIRRKICIFVRVSASNEAEITCKQAMNKRIKVIKCPQCGSTKIEEIKPEHYRCKSCSSEFFLDNDDITIHHRYETPGLEQILGKGTKAILAAIVGITVFVFVAIMGGFSHTGTQHNDTTLTVDTSTAKENENFRIEKIVPFAGKEGRAVVAVFGMLSTGDYQTQNQSYVMRLYDVEKQEQLSDLTLPVDKLDNVSYKLFEDGTLNILINKNKWFELDRTTYALREVTLYKNVSALRDGFATIEFIGKDDSDGFKIMTNLGKERYYLPIINKVYTQRQYFNATAEALPNPVIRTAFNFSHPTHDYPEEPIQLIKYTQYWQVGYPHDDYWSFGWCRDFGEKAGISFGNAGSKKAFISTFGRKQAHLIKYSDFTPGAHYFDASVLWFDNKQLLIRYKPTAAPDITFVYQLLDAKTAQRKWSVRAPKTLKEGFIAPIVKTAQGFLIANFDTVWFLGNDGKTRSIFSLR